MKEKKPDLYRILQVSDEAEAELIDAAYRCLSKRYHPDVSRSSGDEERMKEINMAYAVLGDPGKRRAYHREWAAGRRKERQENRPPDEGRNPFRPGGAEGAGARKAEAAGREEGEERKKEKEEEKQACRVLEAFFYDTLTENWEAAYGKLTERDRENVSCADFSAWREAVSQVYRLGSYRLFFFRRYPNCEYAGTVYPLVLHFSVALTELQLSSGKITEESVQKYVAFDGTQWGVCLGYTDLSAGIEKFRFLARALPRTEENNLYQKAIEKIDLATGVLSRKGLLEQARTEFLRSLRYGSPLSAAAVRVIPEDPQRRADVPAREEKAEEKEKQRTLCAGYVAEKLSEGLRRTDILGRWDEDTFVILFTETGPAGAEEAAAKLPGYCRPEEFIRYELAVCHGTLEGKEERDAERQLEGLVRRCASKGSVKEEEASSRKRRPDPEQERESGGRPEPGKEKLGKYKLSEILQFNKKGKNHF